MARILITAASLLFCVAAHAQTPFTCARVDTPGVVRAEGLTELLPDIVLECTGGRATATTPIYTILLSVQGTWAVRPPLSPVAGTPAIPGASAPSWNEALLIVDDPNPFSQTVCLPVPNFTSCAPRANANIFPARALENNLIGFTEIPVVPPGEGKIRRLRVTNLRVNVPLSIVRSPEITTSIQMFDYLGALVNLSPREGVSAKAQASYSFRLADASGNAVTALTPALVASPSALPLNTPGSGASFQAVFEEGFSSAFRRRNIATTGVTPGNLQSQNVPGLAYNTETGFFDIGLPITNTISRSGSADSGTRLRLSFENLPRNVILWVSIRDIANGTRNYDPANPKALLTSATPNGEGPFSPPTPYVPGWEAVYADNGKAHVVWEVVSADPTAIDRISFGIALAAQGVAGTGAAEVRGSIAPFVDAPTSTLAATPRFVVTAPAIAAFTITNSIRTSPAAFTSAASFSGSALASGSIATAFGTGFSVETTAGTYPLPTTLNGLQVQLIDSTGASRFAPLLVVSPGQVNFLVPDEIRTGPVLINLIRQGITVSSGLANVQPVVPGLFSAAGTGAGAAAGTALTLASIGSNPLLPLARQDAATGLWKPAPLVLRPDEPVYLSLYGTGIRNRRDLTGLTATLGGQPVPVLYAGPQSDLPGIDQINLGPLPASLRGLGELELVITVDGQEANRVLIAIE